MTECTSYYIVCTCLTSVVVVGLSRALSYRNLSRQPPDSSFYFSLFSYFYFASFAHFLTFCNLSREHKRSTFVTPSLVCSRWRANCASMFVCVSVWEWVWIFEATQHRILAFCVPWQAKYDVMWCDMIWMWEKRLIRNYLSNNVPKKGRCFSNYKLSLIRKIKNHADQSKW